MWDCIIPHLLRNWMSANDIHSRRLTLWLAFTPDSPLRHRVALSRYAPTLNENTNDRASSPIGESNPKDRPNRWENLSSLSTTPHSYVEPTWDRIRFLHIYSLQLNHVQPMWDFQHSLSHRGWVFFFYFFSPFKE